MAIVYWDKYLAVISQDPTRFDYTKASFPEVKKTQE